MKPIFAIDITNDKKNTDLGGQEFVVATTSAWQAAALERSEETAESMVKKSKHPLLLRIIAYSCLLLGFTMLFGFIRGASEVGVTQAYQNASWIIWISAVCLIIGGLLTALERRQSKTVMESRATQNALSTLDRVTESVYEELGVPQNARDVDVLIFRYKLKNGKPIPKTVGLASSPFINTAVKIFIRDDHLCLADLEKTYAFHRSTLRAIRTVKKNILLPNWNKPTPPMEGHYKPYKMQVNQYGQVILRTYHILELEQNNQLYAIYFPAYDRPLFESATGLRAEGV